jgi:hypothetical protein
MLRTIGRATFLVVVLTGFAFARAAAAEYYVVDPNAAVYIAWTEDTTGHLQGQVDIVSMATSASTQLSTSNASFTGTRSGSDVSLTFGTFSRFSGATWTGHTGWNTLTLIIPTSGTPQQLTLHAGSFANFQAAVSNMQGSASTNQEHQNLLNAVQEATNHVVHAGQAMDEGLAALRTLLPIAPTSNNALRLVYPAQWKKMQAAWAHEQAVGAVTPTTCYQKSNVEYAASQVSYELSSFNYLDARYHGIEGEYNGAVNKVNGAITELSEWAPVLDDRARAYKNAMGQTYSRSAAALVGPPIANARKSLSIFADRWEKITETVDDYDQRAKQQNEDARQFANAIDCSG